MSVYSGTLKQVEARYGLKRDAVYDLIRDKKVKTFTVGRRRFINFESLDSYLASLQGERAVA